MTEQEIQFEPSYESLRAELPLDVLRSSTVESLLSQNEDLTARLRVTVQRLAAIENESYQSRTEIDGLNRQLNALHDQILVSREKQIYEKQKDEALEKQIVNLKRQLDITQMEYAELRNSGQKLKIALFFLQNYRRRITAWVNPAFKKLRREFKHAQEQLSQNEKIIQALREQILEVSKSASKQVAEVQKQNQELVEYNESERKIWTGQNDLLKNINLELERKIELLERDAEQHDGIQNRNITLERIRSETQKKHQSEIEVHMASEQKLSAELQGLRADCSALTIKNQELADAHSQLESTRSLWKEKCEELQNLQAAYAALDKLSKK